MALYSEDNVTKALETILRCLRKVDGGVDDREELRQEVNELWPEIQRLHGGNAYNQHITSYIDEEHRRLHNPREDEVPREQPLCGCSSPTCPLKRGELPAKAKTRAGSSIVDTDPHAAVAETIEQHTKPYVLKEAAEAWHDETGEALMELYELKSDAEYLLNKQRGTLHNG